MHYRDAKVCLGTLDGGLCGWIYMTMVCPRCAGQKYVTVLELLNESTTVSHLLHPQPPDQPPGP